MAEEFRTPQSANEAALQNWAGADNELRAPQSRIEKLLLAILGEDVTPDPPQIVNEELLTQILEQGGGGGSGDFELVYTTQKYVVEDEFPTVSEEDYQALKLGVTQGYFAIAYASAEDFSIIVPLYLVPSTLGNSAARATNISAQAGKASNGSSGRSYVSFYLWRDPDTQLIFCYQIKALKDGASIQNAEVYYKIYKIK